MSYKRPKSQKKEGNIGFLKKDIFIWTGLIRLSLYVKELIFVQIHLRPNFTISNALELSCY